MFADAARLLYEGWLYAPYGIAIDLTLFHLYLRRRAS